MKKLISVGTLCLCGLFLMQGTAHGQQIDVAFGMNALTAPSAGSASGSYFPQSLRGGAFPSFSGDFLFFHHLGIGAEVSWRGSRSFYQGFGSQPFRPLLYDFSAVWAPRLAKSFSPELMAGIGVESIRFYQNFIICNITTCTNYVSSNHFLGHFGAGIRWYVVPHVFLRPEAHIYLIRNNFEFSSAHATRFGMSIGFTFGS